jgi:hypothetical protein
MHRQTARIDQTDGFGHRQSAKRRGHGIFGIATARQKRRDFIAYAKSRHGLIEGNDRARSFQARRLRRTRRRRMVPLHLQ